MRHSYSEKLDVVRSILSGKSIKSVSLERHLDRRLVRSWLDCYRYYGEQGLLRIYNSKSLALAEKEEIISLYVNNRLPLRELSLRYEVSQWSILKWVRRYRCGLWPVGLSRISMARPKKREPQTELEKLRAENLRLRAENALLKKVKALVEERKARAMANGQEPSMN